MFMRILIADLFSKDAIAALEKAGHEIIYNDKLAGDTLDQAITQHQPTVLVVRSTKVPKNTIDLGSSLELIVRAGAGTDTIDVKHAATKGIYVANCPGKNANAVSELAIGLIVGIDRRMSEQNELLKQGKWRKGDFVNQKGLKDRTVGIIGFGAIGSRVAKAAIAMEMHVLVNSRNQDQALADSIGFRYVSREELLQNSDIVSVHVPGGAETKEMINKDFLAKMKPDGVLLNTSRGSVVNDADILAHLNDNPNFWYGTDVFNGEPSGKEAEWKCDLSVHERVYGTHHCGASTKQAEAAIGEEALRVILKFAATRSVDAENTVNRAKKDSSLLHM